MQQLQVSETFSSSLWLSFLRVHPSLSAIKLAKLDPSNINAVNPGFNSGSCPASPNGHSYGWHFVLPDISHSFISINCKFAKTGVVTEMVQEPCGMHAYVYTPSGDTLVSATANVTGSSDVFILNDVCSPPSKFPRYIYIHDLSVFFKDPCLEENGGCDGNALCSFDVSANRVQCACKTGYENTGNEKLVTCKGKICSTLTFQLIILF